MRYHADMIEHPDRTTDGERDEVIPHPPAFKYTA